MFPHVNSTPRIPDPGFQSLSLGLGFWIPIVSGIPDSLSCIPDSTTQDSSFHGKNVPHFGIRFPLHGANHVLWEGNDNFSLVVVII